MVEWGMPTTTVPTVQTTPPVLGLAAGAPGAGLIAEQRAELTAAGVPASAVTAVAAEGRVTALTRLITTAPPGAVVVVAAPAVLGTTVAELAAVVKIASARRVTLAVVVAGEAVGLSPTSEAVRFILAVLRGLGRSAEALEARKATAALTRPRGGRPRVLTPEQEGDVAAHPEQTARTLAARLGVAVRTVERTRQRLREEAAG